VAGRPATVANSADHRSNWLEIASDPTGGGIGSLAYSINAQANDFRREDQQPSLRRRATSPIAAGNRYQLNDPAIEARASCRVRLKAPMVAALIADRVVWCWTKRPNWRRR
jgi:hypothetical protein